MAVCFQWFASVGFRDSGCCRIPQTANGIADGKMPLMETVVSVDKAGRLVLPKKVREELHLQPGDTLDLSSDGVQVILRPSRGSSRMRQVQGVWVFSSGSRITLDETNRVTDDIRRGRGGE